MSLLFRPAGYLSGLIDVGYAWVKRRSSNQGDVQPARFFTDGWGDFDKLEKCEDVVKRAIADGQLPPLFPTQKALVLGKGENEDSDLCLEEYVFNSPIESFLPEVSKKGFFRVVKPKENNAIANAVVVHLAATGDQFYAFRRKLLADKLARNGIINILIMVPFYGTRRPQDQTKHYVRNVSDYLIASTGCMVEGAAVARWAQDFYKLPVILTGMSFGGAMATCASLMVKGPLGLVPCVASASPKVLVTGILSSEVQWHSLMPAASGASSDQSSKELLAQTKAKLLQIFSDRDLEHVVDSKGRELNRQWSIDSTDGGPKVCTCIAALHDSFVPPEAAEELFGKVKCWISPEYFQSHWINGGHVTAMGLAGINFVPSILEVRDSLLKVVGAGTAQ